MSTPTRWAGVPLTDRRAERRTLLIDAAFRLFGEGGEAAASVRSVCRECGLNTRYFYESFTDTDDLLGAVYDEVSTLLAADVEAAMAAAGDSLRARTRAGIAAVLGFSSADPRRGRILFTDARANPVLAARRAATQDLLREAVLTEGGRQHPDSDPVAAQVGAAMYTGAMAELAQQWLAGNLGDDLDAVVDHALRLVLGR
ncbi:TetR family transcriptional regulator [Mycolicibacterium mageritense DSM 44476 = CIP 104973]|uniref:TetR family transcriptional regulator n=1 Tax=Mycolicibacterium mageritense TaxID=53462 RepID=A0ABN5YCP4_MYCME|nr:TetR/AcrR family transcriptional regulator [Mycolicibacterium mageritense]MCC9183111.1 TetR/AcrR family transcriptional regulator [Mycolicibacterium mageritense]BBX34924.1 TetR family transcriptional regulator [Mycolicibacterium mageritense]GJJ22482.1 TetR family transcriptional regulator [Mycolicibacterium mageritense]CDO20559.1 TetR family transcriptional regulator [Mycolicibacterium mageritense DSM 44476 = CIP 104973]